MDEKIIDGNKLAYLHEKIVREKVARLGFRPKIVSILVGDDPASALYSKLKKEKAASVGIEFELKQFSQNTPFGDVSAEISRLNQNPKVNGIMVQLPLSESFLGDFSKYDLLNQINPQKDVDGLTGASSVLPATVRAVLEILEDEKISLEGKVVVVGRSDLVGKPLAITLQKMGVNVSVGHSKTEDLKALTSLADVLISATGQPHLIKGDMVKSGAVVIDVGTAKLNGSIVGDVDMTSVYPKVSKITPVPGGVGPMTVVALMENMVKLASY